MASRRRASRAPQLDFVSSEEDYLLAEAAPAATPQRPQRALRTVKEEEEIPAPSTVTAKPASTRKRSKPAASPPAAAAAAPSPAPAAPSAKPDTAAPLAAASTPLTAARPKRGLLQKNFFVSSFSVLNLSADHLRCLCCLSPRAFPWDLAGCV